MENRPPSTDGVVDEKNGHDLDDNALLFDESLPQNAMGLEGVSRDFGVSTTGTSHEIEDILDANVLHDDIGYLRLQNDFCSINDEYLLGSEFVESIEGLQSSFAGIDTCWKADQLNIDGCGYGELQDQCPELEPSPEEKPSSSSTLGDVGKFHSISSCTFQDALSDEADTGLSSRKNEFSVIGEGAETAGSHEKASGAGHDHDHRPVQKRSRKPTQRYIDQIPDPIPKQSKKRRAVALPETTKGRKKYAVKPQAEEEPSVKAIQVPFGSFVHKECPESPKSPAYEPPRIPERGYQMMIKSRDSNPAPKTRKRREHHHIAADILQKKRNQGAVLSKKSKRHLKVQNQSKRDDCLTDDSPEEGNVRRKHHILWTIAEVKQLIDGVAEFGVGRWSRIKKLFFCTSAHRTSVDLKDKWRNLLKASGLMGRGNHKGEGKRSLAWRPLPKSIMRRVCELAAMYPYPKGQNQAAPMIKYIQRGGSPDQSTEMTLNDYRKILRTVDSN